MFTLTVLLLAQTVVTPAGDPLFVDEAGSQILIANGAPVPFARAGDVIVPVSFLSGHFDPATGTFGFPDLKGVFSMTADGVPFSTYQAHDKDFVFGGPGCWPNITVTGFDPSTGQGSATVYLPVYLNEERAGWPFPDPGQANVVLYWGTESELFHTGQAPPSGAQGSLGFSFLVSHPSVVLGTLEARSMAIGDVGRGFARVENPSPTPRSFLLTSSDIDVITVPSVISLPANETFIFFGVQAVGPGQASFSALESGGIGAAGFSSVCMVDARTEILTSSGSAPGPAWPDRHCLPAVLMPNSGSNQWRVCSRPCKLLPLETAQLEDCAGQTPMGADVWLLKKKALCVPRTSHYCNPYCWEKSGQKAWKLVDSEIEDCVSANLLIFEIHTVRMCCLFERQENVSGNVTIPDCYGTGVPMKEDPAGQ